MGTDRDICLFVPLSLRGTDRDTPLKGVSPVPAPEQGDISSGTKMNENSQRHKATDLVPADYARMQVLISALHKDALESGADPLTLAHAVAPLAVELLLHFHEPEDVSKVLARQATLISLMLEKDGASVQ